MSIDVFDWLRSHNKFDFFLSFLLFELPPNLKAARGLGTLCEISMDALEYKTGTGVRFIFSIWRMRPSKEILGPANCGMGKQCALEFRMTLEIERMMRLLDARWRSFVLSDNGTTYTSN